MRPFKHVNAKSVNEAVTALAGGKNKAVAGGTDLLGTLKQNILPTYPNTVINLKTISGLDYIKEEGGILKIGALTRLADIAAMRRKNGYAALPGSQGSCTPNIRNMGTIGGNISSLTAAGTSASRITALTAYARTVRSASRFPATTGITPSSAESRPTLPPALRNAPQERIFPPTLLSSAPVTGTRLPA